MSVSGISIVIVYSQTNQEVSGNLIAQEVAGHAWGDFEQVWYYTLVKAAEAFLGSDDSNGVEYALVFVAHTFHLVNLESATENITTKVSQASSQGTEKRGPYRGYVQV